MEDKILEALLLRPGMASADEELLEDMVSDCVAEVKNLLNYKEGDALPGGCAPIIKQMVLIKFNQDGAEGEASESNSGVSVTYLTGIPAQVKAQLYRYRKLRR